MLAVKAKDTGASVLKKGLQKHFSGDLQKNGLQKIFSGDLQNFDDSETNAILEPRTEKFSRTSGFEAKDLTFEAKAKDFKMYP